MSSIRAEKSAGLLNNAYVGLKVEEEENCKVILHVTTVILFHFYISEYQAALNRGVFLLNSAAWLNKFALCRE